MKSRIFSSIIVVLWSHARWCAAVLPATTKRSIAFTSDHFQSLSPNERPASALHALPVNESAEQTLGRVFLEARMLSEKVIRKELALPVSGESSRIEELCKLVRSYAIRGTFSYLCVLGFGTLLYLQLRRTSYIDARSLARARLSFVATGEVEENRFYVQHGYKEWALGSGLFAAFLLVPLVTQFMLGVLTYDLYFGAGWDSTAVEFIFLAVLSHGFLLASAAYTAQFQTFFKLQCDLSEAGQVLVEEEDEAGDGNDADAEATGSCTRRLGRDQSKPLTRSTLVNVQRTDEDQRFYEYTCVRYLWDDSTSRFRPVGTLDVSGESAHATLANGGLTAVEAVNGRSKYGMNEVHVAVPGVMQSLFLEFFDFVYIFQLFAIWVYMYYSTWNYASLWLVLVFGIGAVKCLFIVRVNQLKIQEMSQAGSNQVQRVLRSGAWVDVKATELVLGDVVQVSEGMVTADIVVLAGSVVVNETMLTGEPMPIQKTAMSSHMNFKFDISTHGKKHGLLTGTTVMQSVADDTGPSQGKGSARALGIVIGVGGRTMKSQLIRMVLFPSVVKFKYTEQLPTVYTAMALYSFLLFIIVTSYQERALSVCFFTWACFLIQCLNPMLPVSLTMGQSVSAKRLEASGTVCLSLGRLPIAGKIVVMVFDKTGTITHGGMDLCTVLPLNSPNGFGEEVAASELNSKLQGNTLLQALASCHTVTTMRDGTLVGNAVEVSTVKALDWKMPAAGQARVIEAPDGTENLEVIRQLEFDHHRMTSGAVVRSQSSGKTFVFVKGAYDKVEKIVATASLPSNFLELCENYAKQCYYVLAISYKEIAASSADDVEVMPRDELEQGLLLCGLMLFRNEIKPDSKDAIGQLVDGGTLCVMCTGDNAATGASIARQCGIIGEGKQVLIGDATQSGEVQWKDAESEAIVEDITAADTSAELVMTQSAFRSLLRKGDAQVEEILPRVKVFGRMKPDDKVKVITLWQKYQGVGRITGMVGDGGNDCGALRVAHAGIALSEAEASMVSPFSSRKGLDDSGYISLTSVVDLIAEGRACLATNMSCFMLFMVYSFILTTSKIYGVLAGDLNFTEWHFIVIDVGISMGMVWTMTQCGSVSKLAPSRPTSSLLGSRTVTCIVGVVLIYWLFASAMIYDLKYLTGNSFYEPYNSIYMEVPGEAWTKKGDNYITSSLFLLMTATIATAGYVFSYGDAFRPGVLFNPYLNLLYLAILGSLLFIVWTPPNDFNCVFRANCDNAKSRSLQQPWIKRISTGAVGGGFLGPQMMSCRSDDGLCWVVPPNELDLPTSWRPLSGIGRPKAPFDTLDQKQDYCKQHPYKPGDASDPGNRWCFYPSADNNYEPVPPKLFEQEVKMCSGPNNCYSDDFRRDMTCFVIGSAVALHAMYSLALKYFGRGR